MRFQSSNLRNLNPALFSSSNTVKSDANKAQEPQLKIQNKILRKSIQNHLVSERMWRNNNLQNLNVHSNFLRRNKTERNSVVLVRNIIKDSDDKHDRIRSNMKTSPRRVNHQKSDKSEKDDSFIEYKSKKPLTLEVWSEDENYPFPKQQQEKVTSNLRNKTVKSGKAFLQQNQNKNKNYKNVAADAWVTSSTPWILNKGATEQRKIKSVAYSRRQSRKQWKPSLKTTQSQTNKVIMDRAFDNEHFSRI